jgi:hypothetical protein
VNTSLYETQLNIKTINRFSFSYSIITILQQAKINFLHTSDSIFYLFKNKILYPFKNCAAVNTAISAVL